MAAKSLAPQQQRSRESLRKLLKAAGEVLGQHGVDGATIPRIAAHAGLTPGAIYRRFKDKDALIEAVILGLLERQDERLKLQLMPDDAKQIPLALFAEQLIGGMVMSYRANAALLRAMRTFSQSRVHTPFWRKAGRYEERALERLIELFLAHRAEISHPDPRAAVSMGVMMVISTLFELVVMPTDLGPMKAFVQKDDLGFKRELTRAFLNYLGVGGSDTASRERSERAKRRSGGGAPPHC
jgi:AcrR family transcriptional regulator